MVTHPCRNESGLDSNAMQLTEVRAIDKQAELSAIGEFTLEEACQNVFATLPQDSGYDLNELKDMNTNFN